MSLATQSIGGHRVVERVDSFGGDVYLTCREDGTAALVALLDVDDVTALGVEEDAATCLFLGSRHVAHVVELFEVEGRHAMAFEVLRGATLATLIDERRRRGENIDDAAVLWVGLAMCRALASAHALRDTNAGPTPLCHTRLAPDQIFLSASGDVQLLGLDLGALFRANADSLAAAKRHMAPEVKRGRVVTPLANAYSAASILWSLLAHREPEGDDAYEKLEHIRPDLPLRLARFIDFALEPDAEKRRITCLHLADAIGAAFKPNREALSRALEDVLGPNEQTHPLVFPLAALGPDDEWDSEPPTGMRLAADDVEDDEIGEEETVIRDLSPDAAAVLAAHQARARPAPVPSKKKTLIPQPNTPADPKLLSKNRTLRPGNAVLEALPLAIDEPDEESPPSSGRIRPGQAVMPGKKVKPAAPHRPKMKTMQGIPGVTPGLPQDIVPVPDEPLEKRQDSERPSFPDLASFPDAEEGAEAKPASREPRRDAPDRGVDRGTVGLLVAAASVVALAAGVAIGRYTANPGGPQASPVPTAATVAPSAKSLDTVQPAPSATIAPLPAATATAAASATAAPSAEAGPNTTILEIETSRKDAHLYLDGDHIGTVEPHMSVPCGVHYLRLGTYPLDDWLSKGRTLPLPCGKSMLLTMENYYTGERLKR